MYKKPKYIITNKEGNIKLYIYNVNLDSIIDVLRFKSLHVNAYIPTELWNEMCDFLDDIEV